MKTRTRKRGATSAMKRERARKNHELWHGCKKNALHSVYERIYHFKNYVFRLRLCLCVCVFEWVRFLHVGFSAQLFPFNSFHLWHFVQNYLFVYSFAFRFYCDFFRIDSLLLLLDLLLAFDAPANIASFSFTISLCEVLVCVFSLFFDGSFIAFASFYAQFLLVRSFSTAWCFRHYWFFPIASYVLVANYFTLCLLNSGGVKLWLLATQHYIFSLPKGLRARATKNSWIKKLLQPNCLWKCK